MVTIAFEQGVCVLHPRLPGDVGDGFPFRGPVHVVTAYNPRGLVSDEASNAARHRALLDRVETIGVESFATVGSGTDGSMREPGVLLVGLDRVSAIALGRRFGQSAIYEWRSDRLALVGALEPGIRILGWSLGTSDESAFDNSRNGH